jgi:hypothetical protein
MTYLHIDCSYRFVERFVVAPTGDQSMTYLQDDCSYRRAGTVRGGRPVYEHSSTSRCQFIVDPYGSVTYLQEIAHTDVRAYFVVADRPLTIHAPMLVYRRSNVGRDDLSVTLLLGELPPGALPRGEWTPLDTLLIHSSYTPKTPLNHP